MSRVMPRKALVRQHRQLRDLLLQIMETDINDEVTLQALREPTSALLHELKADLERYGAASDTEDTRALSTITCILREAEAAPCPLV